MIDVLVSQGSIKIFFTRHDSAQPPYRKSGTLTESVTDGHDRVQDTDAFTLAEKEGFAAVNSICFLTREIQCNKLDLYLLNSP